MLGRRVCVGYIGIVAKMGTCAIYDICWIIWGSISFQDGSYYVIIGSDWGRMMEKKIEATIYSCGLTDTLGWARSMLRAEMLTKWLVALMLMRSFYA